MYGIHLRLHSTMANASRSAADCLRSPELREREKKAMGCESCVSVPPIAVPEASVVIMSGEPGLGTAKTDFAIASFSFPIALSADSGRGRRPALKASRSGRTLSE